MELTVSTPPYVIPSYSLTGDLLAYLKCGLQYRYHNKTGLPPSKPVQLWFGEFVHALMEEAYLRWSHATAPRTFPWDWQQDIRPMELEINRRLAARGLPAPSAEFCPFDASAGGTSRCHCAKAKSKNHKLLASRRVDELINTWAQHLFPMIAEAEVTLQGIRDMPVQGARRADYYEVTGRVDVIGSVGLANAPRGNLILHYLNAETNVQSALSVLKGQSYEIILDYKGMRRPSITSPAWDHFAWQVRTYAWLRAQKPLAYPVVAGIVLFANELEPSSQTMEELQDDVRKQSTDVMPVGRDYDLVTKWKKGDRVPNLSTALREKRSIRIVTIDPASVHTSLDEFDAVVGDIETSVLHEMQGQGIVLPWRQRPSRQPYIAPERRTCTVCDFRHFCPLAQRVGEGGLPLAP